MAVAMIEAMLQPAACVVVLVALVPTTVHTLGLDHHFDSPHSSSSGGGCGHSSTSSSGSSSSTSSSSSGGSSSSTSPLPPPDARTVFVTSTGHTGNLGGIAGADEICQDAATSGGFGNHVFRAWVSDNTSAEVVSAHDRMADGPPWFTVNDTLAFGGKLDTVNPPYFQIVDENGVVATSAVWSGSDTRGQPTGLDCDGWTNATAAVEGTVGDNVAHDTKWGGGTTQDTCNLARALVCFQQ